MVEEAAARCGPHVGKMSFGRVIGFPTALLATESFMVVKHISSTLYTMAFTLNTFGRLLHVGMLW